jgi:hypothetical protein
MKKIILTTLVALASMTSIQAQSPYTKYRMSSISTKDFQIRLAEDGELYIDIQSLDGTINKVGIILKKEYSPGFLLCLDSAKKKYSEWKSVAIKNGIRELRKPIECECLVDGYFSYGEWEFDFGKTPTFLFVVGQSSGKTTYSLLMITGKMTSSSNKYIKMDGAALVFDSEKEIDSFMGKIKPEAIEAFLAKPKKEDLFR